MASLQNYNSNWWDLINLKNNFPEQGSRVLEKFENAVFVKLGKLIAILFMKTSQRSCIIDIS